MPTFAQLYDPAIPNEIQPGLVLHLDPDRLLQDGACHSVSNAARVQGQHFFLCIAIEHGTTKWVPLFTNASADRLELPKQGRYGHPKWCGGVFRFYPGQVWSASSQVVANAAARAHDKTRSGTRNGIDPSLIPNASP